MDLPAGAKGYERLYVIIGRPRLALGEQQFVLGAGEAAEFDTRVPHGIGNAGQKPLEPLIIFGPQGGRVHPRAGSTTRAAAPGVPPG